DRLALEAGQDVRQFDAGAGGVQGAGVGAGQRTGGVTGIGVHRRFRGDKVARVTIPTVPRSASERQPRGSDWSGTGEAATGNVRPSRERRCSPCRAVSRGFPVMPSPCRFAGLLLAVALTAGTLHARAEPPGEQSAPEEVLERFALPKDGPLLVPV